MEKEKIAGQLFAGPITDKGQLLLALAINQQAGEDGWVYKTVLVLGKLARLGKTAAYEKLAELEKMGLVERQMGPPHAVRLDRQAVLGDRETVIGDRQANSGGFRETVISDRQAVIGDRQTNSPSPPAYLPLEDKDLKEEEEEEKITASPPPPPSGDLVLVASNETPKSPRFDQPAAQPPAVVEQSDLLPVPAKPKRKRAKSKRAPLPDDWVPDQDTLDQCERLGIPRDFAETTIWEFRRFWESNGKTMADWGGTFVNNAKRCWKKEQENAQKAKQRERCTDATGRSISEREATVRDAKLRFLADLESGVMDNFDLDTPV
jgi:hypothetical protein